jgi:enoyl-CoA hydratase
VDAFVHAPSLSEIHLALSGNNDGVLKERYYRAAVAPQGDSDQRPSGGVRLEIDGGVAVVTIDRPEKRNAIGFATVEELDVAVEEVAGSSAAVLVLRGGGDRAFVSGGDLQELGAVRTHEDAVAMARRMRRVLDRVSALPIPVLAALNGHALGGGAEVAFAADIRIAADDVTIGFNQARLGIMPAWGGAERLAQTIGRGRAILAVSTGEVYDAPSAERLGLVDLVVPRSTFEDDWRALAGRIAATATGTSRGVKSVIAAAIPSVHSHLEDDATDAFAQLWTAEAHWAAVDALGERRKSN